MYCMHGKEPQNLPEHTSEHVKSPGDVPPDPLSYSILWAPLFVFALGPFNSLGAPGQSASEWSALALPG